jgi:hypothetical protein
MRTGTPPEVIALLNYIKKNNLSISAIFKTKQLISVAEFQTTLQNVGFISQDFNKLVEALDT